MNNSIAHKYVVVYTLLTALSLSGCADREPPAVKSVIRPAKIVTVADGMSLKLREFPGEAQASDRSVLSFRVAGELIKLPAKAGTAVKKGQLLAQLDPTDFKLRLDDRQARYDLALVQYKRAKELVETKLIPIADYDKAKSRMLATKSDLSLAKADMQYTKLVAPFKGVVSKVIVDNHENVQAKQAILNVQGREYMDIIIYIPESVVARIKTGRRQDIDMLVSFDTHPEHQYPATIKEADTEADPNTQTFKIKLTIKQPTEFIAIEGMSVTVKADFSKVLIDASDKIIIPTEAVFVPDNKPMDSAERFIWLVDPKTMQVKMTTVEVGELTQAGIEILSGLKSGDQVVTAGVHFLKENQQIKPWVKERGL